jgi:hypothetical protein
MAAPAATTTGTRRGVALGGRQGAAFEALRVCLLAGMVVALAAPGKAPGGSVLGHSVSAGQAKQPGGSAADGVAGPHGSAAASDTSHLRGDADLSGGGPSPTTRLRGVADQPSWEPAAVVELWLPRVVRGQASGTGEPSTPGPTPTSRGGPIRPTDVPEPTPYGDVYAGCQVIEREVVASDGKETVAYTRSLQYNAFSMPVREILLDSHGSNDLIAEWTYDRDRPVQALVDREPDGQWDDLYTWKYREDGQVSLYEEYDLPNRTEPTTQYVYEYDDKNRLSRWSRFTPGVHGLALQSTYIYQYDDLGRLDERLDLRGGGPGVDGREYYSWTGDVLTGYTYDGYDDGMVDYHDLTVEMVYDESQRLITSTLRQPGSNVPEIVSYEYNDYGWLVRRWRGTSRGVAYTYDWAGRLLTADFPLWERRYRNICPKP